MEKKLTFNISLSVLNHLGRNLYRNVITVLGEAISNSWDADASNVWITIDKEHNCMTIVDDGDGMNFDDFQNKFLKIGYSKRRNGRYRTPSGRPFIGRKGIGKLALLSCAKKIHVASKTKETDFVGGIIDNSSLDQAITDDLNSQEYILGNLTSKVLLSANIIEKGTYILFENVNEGITNTVDYIKKSVALYFRFSLLDKNFNIFVNNEKIDEKMLGKLAEGTQFLWKIDDIEDPFIKQLSLESKPKILKPKINIKGYIASVDKPSKLKIRGTQEKVSIDLFVNGRLREKDILRHIPTSRIVENYVYGQIHFDDLDSGGTKDIFTSSREGIISDDLCYRKFLGEIERLFKNIMDDWDELRRKKGDDGDPDNMKITRKARKAQELFNTTFKEMKENHKKDENHKKKKSNYVDNWIKELSGEAEYNIPSYVECFIAENLLREYIKYNKMKLSQEAVSEAKKWKEKENKNKGIANISYEIRKSKDDIYYLDMKYLSNFIDKALDKNKDPALSRSSDIYKPVRDAVGHTSIITSTAKRQLSIELENIKARVMKLMDDVE
jgi:Molecular chaperone, HSP90 family